jgi:tartrate/fumarate subfamily iron-sulfur-dependent hydro-lyase beta chain
MEYEFTFPLTETDVSNLHVGDVLYVSGLLFTARDAAHQFMLTLDHVPFEPSEMGLYHCGPLVNQKSDGMWEVISAGPTTSSRMELFEDQFIKQFGIRLIIGKGEMGTRTQKALQKYICVYTSYTGGAGALAADSIRAVQQVYWLEQLGMAEAVWIFNVERFGPLIVAMDAHGASLFRKE